MITIYDVLIDLINILNLNFTQLESIDIDVSDDSPDIINIGYLVTSDDIVKLKNSSKFEEFDDKYDHIYITHTQNNIIISLYKE